MYTIIIVEAIIVEKGFYPHSSVIISLLRIKVAISALHLLCHFMLMFVLI